MHERDQYHHSNSHEDQVPVDAPVSRILQLVAERGRGQEVAELLKREELLLSVVVLDEEFEVLVVRALGLPGHRSHYHR